MQHPEEGIIHAWIDGALSPTESRELEAHIATCSACAASVAEARGLVAASSRIVGHLDVVPGNVIPATPAKAKLSLVRSRWPIAIAATLVLGISLYSRSNDAPGVLRETTSMREFRKPKLGDSAVLAPVTRPAVSQTPPSPPTIGPSARQRAETGEPVTSRMAVVRTAPTAIDQSAPDSIAAATALSAAQVAKVAVGSASGSDGASVSLRGNVAANAAAPVTAPAPAPTAPQSTSLDRAASRTTLPTATAARREASLAQSDFAETNATTRLVGCYEMNASTETFPSRFALVADPVPGAAGLLGVRYLDANGRLADRILDAGWTAEDGRAVVKTVARSPILILSRTGATVAAQSPNGQRTGRVISCR